MDYYCIYYGHIKSLLEKYNVSFEKKYALYPNGNITGIVRDVLIKEYGITPAYYVDNFNYDGKNILSLEQAKEREDESTYYLICSDKEEIFDMIREKIKECVKTERIIDLFPKEIDKSYQQSVLRLLDMIEKESED